MTDCITTIIFLLSQSFLNLHQTPQTTKSISKYVCQYSQQYSIDPLLVISVMWVESRVKNIKKVNKTHDYGIMQVHCPPTTMLSWCPKRKEKLKDIKHNIAIGIYLMSLKKNECKKRKRKIKKHHWIQHYNWNSPNYWKRVIKIREDIRKINNELKRISKKCITN